MQENWIRWNPTKIPEGEFLVTDFIQNREGTKFILDDGNIMVILL
jgi:hypothetical protein